MTTTPGTCTLEDDGDGESGPHLSVDLNEDCPTHGRGTAWAEANGIDYDADDVPTPPWMESDS
jgi:hypothetical protein